MILLQTYSFHSHKYLTRFNNNLQLFSIIQIMTDDKIVIANLKRDGRRRREEQSQDELKIKNFEGDFGNIKNMVGPAFIFCKIMIYESWIIRIWNWFI